MERAQASVKSVVHGQAGTRHRPKDAAAPHAASRHTGDEPGRDTASAPSPRAGQVVRDDHRVRHRQTKAPAPALVWVCTAANKVGRCWAGDDLPCAVVDPPVDWRFRVLAVGAGARPSGGVDLAGFGGVSGVSEQPPRASWRPSIVRSRLCVRTSPATVPGVGRRSLWLDRAGVRWALAVPVRESSDVSAPPRTSCRCWSAPCVRWKQLSSVAG